MLMIIPARRQVQRAIIKPNNLKGGYILLYRAMSSASSEII